MNVYGPGSALDPSQIRPKAVAGVDSIRFLAAAWVALGHGARFPLEHIFDKHSGLIVQMIVGVSNVMFNGVDAVVIFFIISGLCIHYPNAGLSKIDSIKFITRRLVRIMLPLAGVLLVAIMLGNKYVYSVNAVLWTVYCEIAYYILYPILFRISTKISWEKIIVLSVLISIVILALNYRVVYLWELGQLTWLFCLPFWLLGVVLAERFPRSATSPLRLWLWRVGAVLHGIVANELIFHSPIVVGLVWTVPPFAVYSYFWISREIEHWKGGAPKILELLGSASFSIYLIHKLPITFMEYHVLTVGPILRWTLLMALISTLTLLFYTFVERPSHMLARSVGARREMRKA